MRVSKVDGSQNVELQRDALKSAPASPRRSSTKMYDREVPSRFILGYAVRMNANSDYEKQGGGDLWQDQRQRDCETVERDVGLKNARHVVDSDLAVIVR